LLYNIIDYYIKLFINFVFKKTYNKEENIAIVYNYGINRGIKS
jgi:hypothetical protein